MTRRGHRFKSCRADHTKNLLRFPPTSLASKTRPAHFTRKSSAADPIQDRRGDDAKASSVAARHGTAHYIECRSRTPSAIGGVAWPQNFFCGAEPMQILHWLPLVLWVAVTVRVTITIRRRK